FVDIVFGPQAYHRLPEMVTRALADSAGGVLDTSFPAEPKFDYLPERLAAPGTSAFLTVQEGCDKFCTFCVVPFTRGPEYSPPAAHRHLPQLMPFLHLPVQSGSDRVLTAMNRRHTAHQYKRTVERLRKARPDLALSSDFIVGYPGESDDDFRATLDLVREIGF